MYRLKNKINAAPAVIDFQEVPRSAEHLLKITEAFKNGSIKKKRKKKRSKNTLIDTNTLIGKDIKLPGMTKAEKPVPSLVQYPGESDNHFLYRLGNACHEVIQETKFENKYGVNVIRDPLTGNISLEKKTKENPDDIRKQSFRSRDKEHVGSKTLDESRLSKKERRKQKLKEAKKAKLEKHKDEFEKFKDEVKFGETVHAPPILKALPRKAGARDETVKPGRKNLLLKSALQTKNESFSSVTKKIKRRDLPAATRRQLELQRIRVVEAYRTMKAQK
ncbi:hypothetical protein ANN_06201 [Periplaneta americana]|uniref:Coiled-coil domain-containing protein 137 n=1 Tax=Periplaneta americana TaxID=6978 RepID=A0ABQ8TEN3_PERAM|nr:hypothetical protein ANN_06201 [Periplaneta americana]